MNENKGYEAPKVEVIEVAVEKGFAVSPFGSSVTNPGWGNGPSYSDDFNN